MRRNSTISFLALIWLAIALWMGGRFAINGFRIYFEDYYPRNKDIDSLMTGTAASLPDQDKHLPKAFKDRRCQILKNKIVSGYYNPWGCPRDYTFYRARWPDGDEELLYVWAHVLAETQYKGERYRVVRTYVSNPSSSSWPGGKAHITLYLLRRTRQGEWHPQRWQVLETRKLGHNIDGTVKLAFEHDKPKMIVSNIRKREFWDSYFDS